MGLTYDQMLSEPPEEMRKAFLIWSLDAERDNLESRKAQQT